MAGPEDRHGDAPFLEGGAPLASAKAAMVMLHGRHASADGMLTLAERLAQPRIHFLAPQATDANWYPGSFLAPLSENEPSLTSCLKLIERAISRLTAGGLSLDKLVLMGFSQGACLVSEFAARHPARYGGVVACSGGLIGTGEKPGAERPHDKLFDYHGAFWGTAVFFGCHERDPLIPLARVRASAAVFRNLGAAVEERIYPGGGHQVIDDEIHYMKSLLASLSASNASATGAPTV